VFAYSIDQGALIRLGEGLSEGASGGTDADDSGGCLEFRPLSRGDERWQGFHSGMIQPARISINVQQTGQGD
jgi:hypothetical protein